MILGRHWSEPPQTCDVKEQNWRSQTTETWRRSIHRHLHHRKLYVNDRKDSMLHAYLRLPQRVRLHWPQAFRKAWSSTNALLVTKASSTATANLYRFCFYSAYVNCVGAMIELIGTTVSSAATVISSSFVFPMCLQNCVVTIHNCALASQVSSAVAVALSSFVSTLLA